MRGRIRVRRSGVPSAASHVDFPRVEVSKDFRTSAGLHVRGSSEVCFVFISKFFPLFGRVTCLLGISFPSNGGHPWLRTQSWWRRVTAQTAAPGREKAGTESPGSEPPTPARPSQEWLWGRQRPPTGACSGNLQERACSRAPGPLLGGDSPMFFHRWGVFVGVWVQRHTCILGRTRDSRSQETVLHKELLPVLFCAFCPCR